MLCMCLCYVCIYCMQLKIPEASNVKEYYKSYLNRKNTKLVKGSNIIIQQPQTIKNPNIVDIKSVIIEHPKTSHKLSKAIRHSKKFPK